MSSPWRRIHGGWRGLLPGLVWLWAGGLSAQESATLLGRVLDQETQEPVVGAFVALLNPDGSRAAAVLTDATGRYVLRASAPGRYRLRAERIGVDGGLSQFVDVVPGQVQVLDLLTRPAAIDLEGVQVSGTARCDIRGADGTTTVRLWEEARKALQVADWVEDAGFVYDTRSFQRVLGRDGRRVLEESSQLGTHRGRAAFRSMDADTLMARGFVQVAEDGTQSYFAPDAGVLLSDAFLSTHCFRSLEEDGRVGLSFEPAPGRKIADIEGVLWFAGDGVLDRIEYRYQGLPPELQGDRMLGGEIVFTQLQGGVWIVQDWRIRMPRMAEVRDRFNQVVRFELDGYQEAGGQVVRARQAERVEAIFRARRGAVVGRATSGIDGSPLAGGEIFLSGTNVGATVAADGSFLLEDALPGTYALILEHPALTRLGEGGWAQSVSIQADSIASVEVVTPRRDDLLRSRCERSPVLELPEEDRRGEGALRIIGGVLLDDDGAPVTDWPIRIQWRNPAMSGGDQLVWRGAAVWTDARGAWVACGLPEEVEIRADVADRRFSAEEIRLGASRWGRGRTVGQLSPGQVVWVELPPPS